MRLVQISSQNYETFILNANKIDNIFYHALGINNRACRTMVSDRLIYLLLRGDITCRSSRHNSPNNCAIPLLICIVR